MSTTYLTYADEELMSRGGRQTYSCAPWRGPTVKKGERSQYMLVIAHFSAALIPLCHAQLMADLNASRESFTGPLARHTAIDDSRKTVISHQHY